MRITTFRNGFALAMVGMLVGCRSASRTESGGWHDIGASLDGWAQKGGKAAYFMQDGCIVGQTRPNQPNSFLCTERVYRDFELTLEFKVDPALNSGIQIRSESRPDYKNGVVHGYQVEIDPSARAWTAGIYDESRRGWLFNLEHNEEARKAFRQKEWNSLRIVAVGDHIQTWLNGIPAADLHDATTPSGFIGLQVHGVGDRKEPLEVRWRNIKVRELRAADATRATDAAPERPW